MATNNSYKQPTLMTQIEQIPSDVWQIDNMELFCQYKNNVFPIANILDDYRDYFEQDEFLEEIQLDKKYYYAPARFAEDYYGTPDLDFLVMYFAKVTSLFEFNRKTIKVLSPERLRDVNRLIVKYKDVVKQSKENPTQY